MWTIEKTEKGLIIKAESISITDLSRITRLGMSLGYDVLAPGVSKALGAYMVMTKSKTIDAWMKELAGEPV